MTATTPLRIVAPPPLLYLGTLALGFTLQAAAPLAVLPATGLHTLVGSASIAAGALLVRWSFLTMRRLGTSADPGRAALALATSGPFRFSRNPIYVAMTVFYVGIACLLNAAWPLFLLPVLLLVMQRGVIRREEHYLAERFGEAYASYRSRVRRWL